MSEITIPTLSELNSVDGIMVLGYGNSLEHGVSEATLANARRALEIIELGVGDYVIATGLGPRALPYKTPEAEAIEEILGPAAAKQGIPVVTEAQSISTWDNMGNSSVRFGEHLFDPDSNVALVTNPEHARRAKMIGGFVMPWVNFTIIPVDHGPSWKRIIRERIQLELTERSLEGLPAGDNASFVIARERYEKYIALLKIAGDVISAHEGRQD